MKYSRYLLAALSSIIFLSPEIIMGMKKKYTSEEINTILNKTTRINQDTKNTVAFLNNPFNALKALATGFMYAAAIPLSIYTFFAADPYHNKLLACLNIGALAAMIWGTAKLTTSIKKDVKILDHINRIQVNRSGYLISEHGNIDRTDLNISDFEMLNKRYDRYFRKSP